MAAEVERLEGDAVDGFRAELEQIAVGLGDAEHLAGLGHRDVEHDRSERLRIFGTSALPDIRGHIRAEFAREREHGLVRPEHTAAGVPGQVGGRQSAEDPLEHGRADARVDRIVPHAEAVQGDVAAAELPEAGADDLALVPSDEQQQQLPLTDGLLLGVLGERADVATDVCQEHLLIAAIRMITEELDIAAQPTVHRPNSGL